MAISSLKASWVKFSARIRDYLDVMDSYYRPEDEDSRISRAIHKCDHSAIGRPSRGAIGGSSNIGGSNKPHHHRHSLHHNCSSTDHDRAAAKATSSQTPRHRLPPGYSKRKTSHGQVYFVDPNGQQSWYDPSVPKELISASLNLDALVGRLSSNWQIRQTESGKTYFVNHNKKTTQFTDPRLVAYKEQLMNLLKQGALCTNSTRPMAYQTNGNTTSSTVSTTGRLGYQPPACDLNQPLGSTNAGGQSQCQTRNPHERLSSQTRPSGLTSRAYDSYNHHNDVRLPSTTNLRRQLRSALQEQNSGSNQQYQINIDLSGGSQHNLSTTMNHSNTLTGPPPAWFKPSALVGCLRSMQNSAKVTSNIGRNYSNDNNLSCQQQSSRATVEHDDRPTLNSSSLSRQNSGSVGNLCTLAANSGPTTEPTSACNVASQQQQQQTRGNRKELCDKISILRQELLKQQVLAHPCRIDVNRKRIFEESFRVISQMQPRDLKKRLLVKFRGEEGLDYGGVAREWFYLLSREILNPVHGLFQYTSDDIYNLQINPDSGIVYREHLSYLNFCGRIIGMAVFHGHFIEGHFTLPFYKMLLRKPISLEDIEFVDPDLHRSLCWILANDITNVIDTTFLVQHNAFGQLQEHELKEGGRNIAVNEENKREYVSLYVNYRCRRGIESQFEALQRGFYELISPSLVETFDEHELELLIGGLSKINVDDWRTHTKLKNCSVESPLVRWFWDIVKSYSEDKRARLLQFVTGSPRVPIQGFKALQGVNSELRLFTIHLIKNACTDNLPKSHTCFNRIDLPPYESYEKLRDKLTQAIEETMGFAMQ